MARTTALPAAVRRSDAERSAFDLTDGSQTVENSVEHPRSAHRGRVETSEAWRQSWKTRRPTSERSGASIVRDLQPNQRAWLRASEPVTLHESTAIIAVPNDFTRNQLEGRLRGQLEDSLSDALGREIRLAVTVNPALDDGGTTPLPEVSDAQAHRHVDKDT